MTFTLFDGVTHPSSSCRLLDSGRGIEKARQANPFRNTSRYFSNFPFAGEKENEQGAVKTF